MNFFPYVDQDPGAWCPPNSPVGPPNEELREARAVMIAILLGAAIAVGSIAVVVVRLLNLAIDTAWAASQVCR